MPITDRLRWSAAAAIALTVVGGGAVTVAAAASPGLGDRPVFLVRSDTTVDASVAASAAARAEAPLLYTAPSELDARTREYLVGYQPSTVVLVGGPAALSTVVESSVTSLGYTTVRAEGADRSATAVALAQLVADLPKASGAPGAAGAPGPAGPAGAAGARRPAGADGASAATVVDADGEVLGTYFGLEMITSTGHRSGIPWSGRGSATSDWNTYSGPDCTGEVYTEPGQDSAYIPPHARYSTFLGTYLVPVTGTPEEVAPQSMNQGGRCLNGPVHPGYALHLQRVSAEDVGLPASIDLPLAIRTG